LINFIISYLKINLSAPPGGVTKRFKMLTYYLFLWFSTPLCHVGNSILLKTASNDAIVLRTKYLTDSI